MTLNPTNGSTRGLRRGGTVGHGTRPLRKPAVFAIVERTLEAGYPAGSWSVELKARGLSPTKKVTAKTIALTLLDELHDLEYMAASYDPGWTPRHDGLDDARVRYRKTQDDRLSDEVLGLRSSEYAKRAARLEDELGSAFLAGTTKRREAMVRDWIRNWRRQGRLRTGLRPPRRAKAAIDSVEGLASLTEVADRERFRLRGNDREANVVPSLWNRLGFRESPYATTPIPPTDEGERLLVGRDDALARLRTYLNSSATHPTIEGDNGVGKTSLVAVAGYQALTAYVNGDTSQLFVPLEKVFQLSGSESAPEFRRQVLHEVARAFIQHHDLLKRDGYDVPSLDAIDRWLNSPLLTGGGFSANVGGFGGGYSRSATANTSSGFSEAGFDAAVDSWLRSRFPSIQVGGFICVIDNLELLETSRAARHLLEALRDTVLNQPGLRWVLCGARGIVRTGASSPRLEGILAAPMDLRPIADADVAEVIARRIEVFGMGEDAYAPVEPDGFRHIYDVLHANLRNALKFCEDFSFWLDEQDDLHVGSVDRRELLEVWLAHTAEQYVSDTSGVQPRAWRVFDELVGAMDGSCSPSDFEMFGFASMQAFRGSVRQLEQTNLVQSAVDDTDQRRKTIVVTPRGWLVHYQRSGYELAS